jgi:hypothetical protein
MEYIAFDAHKHYTLASVARPDGQLVREQRLPHERGALQQFLARCEPGSPVALETIGNWYWIVDEIEAAGCVPKLVHARKAKLMMGEINKTDKLDVRGLNRLQRNGTLPTVWIPPGELRDQPSAHAHGSCPTAHAAQESHSRHLGQVRLHDLEVSDFFGARGRTLLRQRLELLPPYTAYATQHLLEQCLKASDKCALDGPITTAWSYCSWWSLRTSSRTLRRLAAARRLPTIYACM